MNSSKPYAPKQPTQSPSTGLTYKDSGVDIDAGNRLVDMIKPFCMRTKRLGADAELGGFSGILDLKATGYRDPLILAATDGVGTKLKLAIDANLHDYIGIDLVAMCVNDILVQGGEPLVFLDYYACGQLNPNHAAQIVASIAEGCVQAGCALIGGETAEMPGHYQNQDYDLAGFAIGAVERENLIEKGRVENGDILIGLPSSGAHANGFSLIRKILTLSGYDQKLQEKSPFQDNSSSGESKNFAELILSPTRIYVKLILGLLRHIGRDIHGICHITGGGFYDNLPRIVPAGLAIELDVKSWPRPLLFDWLAQTGNVSWREMHRSFNCGIGLVLAVKPARKQEILAYFADKNEPAYVIGRVGPYQGKDVVIQGIE